MSSCVNFVFYTLQRVSIFLITRITKTAHKGTFIREEIMNIVICPVAIKSNASYHKEGANSSYLISLHFPPIHLSLSKNGFLPKYTLIGLLEIIIAHYLYVTEVIVFCRNRKWVLPSKSTLRAGNLITKNRRRITGS